MIQAGVLRFLLLDVLADDRLIAADRRYEVAARSRVLPDEVALPIAVDARAKWIALFPLMNPITCNTAYFGGIAISTCTWSGSRCPSSIRLSFCPASCPTTSPSYRRSSPYSAFRRHIGMNTTWSLQSQTE